MSRPLRIEYPGAFYHVINRGLERREIFKHPKDYEYFLDLLSHIYEKYGVIVYAYCLMPNHYHLYLQTPQGNLSKAMRQVDGNFTQKFNKRYSRVGPLFQGRYKAVLVDQDSYSLELSKYIHLNPVKAKIVEKPEEYQFSSYSSYIGKTKPLDFLITTFILSQYHKSKKRAVKEFKAFTLQTEPEPWKPETDTFKALIMGDSDFVTNIQDQYISKKVDSEISGLENAKKQITSVQIEAEIAKLKLNNKLSKKLNLYALKKYSQLSLRDIGQRIDGLHYSTVSHKINRLLHQAEKENNIKKILQKIDFSIQQLK